MDSRVQILLFLPRLVVAVGALIIIPPVALALWWLDVEVR